MEQRSSGVIAFKLVGFMLMALVGGYLAIRALFLSGEVDSYEYVFVLGLALVSIVLLVPGLLGTVANLQRFADARGCPPARRRSALLAFLTLMILYCVLAVIRPITAGHVQMQYWAGKRDFQGVDLEGANLRGAHLQGINLKGANVQGADLANANLYDAYLVDADLRGAYLCWADLMGADLRGVDLGGADLTGADLSGANLYHADLPCADLSGADLSGANLSEADLTGADLNGAQVTDEQLAQAASLKGAILPDGSVHE